MNTKHYHRAAFLGLILPSMLWLSGCVTAWHTLADTLPFAITGQPASQTVQARDSVTFSVEATGAKQLSYQWYSGGTPIPGAQSTTYSINKTAVAQTGTRLSVVVSDGMESLTSDVATLTVRPINPKLAFTPIPTLTYGAAPLLVSAATESPAPITYQVKAGPATLSSQMMTITGAGTVQLIASQPSFGDFDAGTAMATVAISQNVHISSINPADLTMAPGSQNFSVEVTGGYTDGVSWGANGGSFSANGFWNSPDTAGTYTITAVSTDDTSQFTYTHVTVSAPVITQQPMSLTGCLGSSANFTVQGLYADSYQWNLNGIPIPGATRPTYYLVNSASVIASDVYTVTLSNRAGSVTSAVASVAQQTVIDKDPSSVSVPAPQSATFTVDAIGLSPFSYQWYAITNGSNPGVAVPGATSATYVTPPTSQMQSGTIFYAAVTDRCGKQMTSAHATLLVTAGNMPPSIDVQPTDLTILPGATGGFHVHATGSPTLNYQWYRVPAGDAVGSPIANATADTLSLQPSQTSIGNDQDSYYVTVSNAFGTAASLHALLKVGGGISITKQPANVYASTGDVGNFSVTATSLLPLTFQWYMADPGSARFAAVPGAISATLDIASVNAAENGASFYVVVSNGITANVQSTAAFLFVDQLAGASACNWLMSGAATENACAYQLTPPEYIQSGQISWPYLISTEEMELSFTATISDSSPIPADGFAVVLGDPSLGATPTSSGANGLGLGAMGIPGVVIAFDDYYDGPNMVPGFAGDPQVPYIGITRGEYALFENPYYAENSAIPALAASGQSISHDYVVSIVKGVIVISMDGKQILSGNMNVPSAAYLYVTSGTGAGYERTIISNLKAITNPVHQ